MPSIDRTTVATATGQAAPPAAMADVTSAYGRVGDVIGVEGDYVIDQMGDVDTTTTAPVTDNLLSWNGTDWTPNNAVDSGTFP